MNVQDALQIGEQQNIDACLACGRYDRGHCLINVCTAAGADGSLAIFVKPTKFTKLPPADVFPDVPQH